MAQIAMREVASGEVPRDGGTALQEDPDRPGFLHSRLHPLNGSMYGHGFATLFLAEAHGMVNNRPLCDYSVGFLASPSLGLGKQALTLHDLAKFPIITFSRRTQPYEIVRSLFNRPDLPPIRLHASASLATVIHMAIEGLGIALIPTAIVESDMADGRLQLLSTNLQLAPLTFSASWLASPDTVAVERVVELAASLARGGVIVDAPREARH